MRRATYPEILEILQRLLKNSDFKNTMRYCGISE